MTTTSTRASRLPMPSANQLTDWRRRLSALVSEMEIAYGPPGENYPSKLNMATYIAFCAAVEDETENVNRIRRGLIAGAP